MGDEMMMAIDIASILPHLVADYGRDEVETAVESWLVENGLTDETETSVDHLASNFDHVAHRYLS